MGTQAMASQARQSSIFNLTLNEVQHHLGEPLHSMNLEELLQNVISVEAGQSLSMGLGGGSIHRQGGIAMNRALSKKTVDEVWREIHHGHKNGMEVGEMTLEAFLVAAEGENGYVGPVAGTDVEAGLRVFGQEVHWPPFIETTPNPQRPGRKRRPVEEVVARTVERRQKRMINNRESAARSRARKQAYTNELENKVSRLEEENEKLKKQEKLETILHYVPPPERKYQLRRSSSSPF